jgi:prepilin-type N-terminal cleavage/methylation domain-containing protein
MRIVKQQAGFSLVEIMVVVIILVGIGFVGWRVYQGQHKAAVTTTAASLPANNQSSAVTGVSSAPAINSTNDLDSALSTLDQNNPNTVNSADSSQLDSQSNF